ncbi:unnamed protein product [marine sediment metagenome]|uniref:Uncharacterized protein n=1 Tax=marine sediment metagenome TaxID=412755 RepID=X0RX82_9ZZZZ
MASASAASNQTVGGTAELIFDSNKGKCSRFFVGVRSTAARALQIHIDGLHEGNEATGDYVGIPAGSALEFQHNVMGIATVWAKGEGGECAGADWAVLTRQGH